MGKLKFAKQLKWQCAGIASKQVHTKPLQVLSLVPELTLSLCVCQLFKHFQVIFFFK